jgi:hypothetical protein
MPTAITTQTRNTPPNLCTVRFGPEEFHAARPFKTYPLTKGETCPKCERSHHIFEGATARATVVFAVGCRTPYKFPI